MRTPHRKVLSLFIALIGMNIFAYGQYTLIPDAAFETRLLSMGIDSEGIQDGRILTADASPVTSLVITNAGITDFTGIQAFTSLQTFWPAYNDITSIDLSTLTQLRDLRATATLLESIDISNNPLLETCYIIASNGIDEVDFSNNPNIMFLLLGANNLANIDVSNLTQLRWLHVNDNPINSLNLSNNPLLNHLNITSTEISNVDLSELPALGTLEAVGAGMTSIDLSNNAALHTLKLNSNALSSLDVSNLNALEYLFCSSNVLQTLDLSNNENLFRVNVSNNQLTTLNVKNGYNHEIDFMIATNNPSLDCVEVDDVSYANLNWNTYIDSGAIFSSDCGSGPDCSVFDTAPVDLNKSFNPVAGLLDRVQLKWYKASPEIKYSDEDAAACDIKYWPIRQLDPITGDIIATISDPDTIDQVNVRKYQNDGVSPREIFKWPVKYRADDANNTKRAEPNTRYQWKVRCACEHGEGQESPWSDVKIFNTPDFDPVTGIYTPPEGVLYQENSDETKKIGNEQQISLFPNPSTGITTLRVDADSFSYRLEDLNGKLLDSHRVNGNRVNLNMTNYEEGIYIVRIITEKESFTERFIISR